MRNKRPFCNLFFSVISRSATTALAMILMFALAFVLTPPAQAQTYRVLYDFSGGADGGIPGAGVTLDAAGNLYGTNLRGNGTVFKLGHSASGWVFSTQYTFQGGNDGGSPYAEVTMGPGGSPYSTTLAPGTVFKLTPPTQASRSDSWAETVLHSFGGGIEGGAPYAGVVFDQAGNLYGTTSAGGGTGCGGFGCGTVYKLTPSNGSWTESVVHAFSGPDGAGPARDLVLVFDNAGNIYGLTEQGGAYGYGAVFQLTPSGSEWTEKVLYSFTGGFDGGYPHGGVIFDRSSNLYGSTSGGLNSGTVFQLSPSGNSWTFKLLYTFGGYSGPEAGLVMDAAGALYGTTAGGGTSCPGNQYGCGTVFKLTPGAQGWTYISLHEFAGSDGKYPYSTVVFDAHGNLYGTTANGGTHCGSDGCDVVWEITR